MAFSPRETGLILAGAVGLSALAAWQYLWLPLQDRMGQAEAALQTVDALAIRVAQLQALDPAPAQIAPTEPLLDRVSRIADEHNLALRQLIPEQGGLRVRLENVPFDLALAWLEALTTMAAVAIDSAGLQRQPEPGKVSIQLLLRDAT